MSKYHVSNTQNIDFYATTYKCHNGKFIRQASLTFTFLQQCRPLYSALLTSLMRESSFIK